MVTRGNHKGALAGCSIGAICCTNAGFFGIGRAGVQACRPALYRRPGARLLRWACWEVDAVRDYVVERLDDRARAGCWWHLVPAECNGRLGAVPVHRHP